ncbi:MAG: hypothetical protein CME19_20285 [Gemmatimonadetes bacterium]|nr:hypothetical protein [Gemmatimonadota bacterium]
MQNIDWTFPYEQPVISPRQLHGDLDAKRAGAGHVIQVGDAYRMYYWGTGADGYHHICLAEAPIDRPNEWTACGSVLDRQPGTAYNDQGPGFPFVVPRVDGSWLMYICGWGIPRADGKLPNTTGMAFSDDAGQSFYYRHDKPTLETDRPWDREGTGSVFVRHDADRFHIYYTSIGDYFDRPEGVETGHGDVIPRIGVGYAVSDDGVSWAKPLDDLMVSPRGFETEPYEYISSKPFLLEEEDGYRMWLHTFGTAYRVRSLFSRDGMHWTWQKSGIDGELGVGKQGCFDDQQRCYVSVIKSGDTYRCWYTGNGFGQTGMGYAEGYGG